MSSDARTRPDPVPQLWQLWEQGRRPNVRAFLAEFPSLTLDQVVAVLRVDQQARWRAGERPPAEDYLFLHPELSATAEPFLDLVYGEYLLREELGEQPSAEEYVGRFPQFAAQLRRQLDVHCGLEAEPSRPPRPSSVTQAAVPAPGLPRNEVAPALPGYEILGELGRGGMGIVYKARQLSLKRTVALKMILGCPDAEHLLRFHTEAEAAARMQHPNIVQIFEVGAQRGQPYLCLEYVEGPSLAQQLGGAPLPPRDAAGLAEQLARAMAYAHQAGVVHRDLKPANVLLASVASRQSSVVKDGTNTCSDNWQPATGNWHSKITDFGLAKYLDEDSGQTQSGTILGTPSYMTPEQAAGSPVGPLADVWALGAILYEMLTGRPPFRGATALETIDQVRQQEPVPPRHLQPTVPRDLETISLKCLQKPPGRRYASAAALADDLKRYLDGVPILARPVGLLERSGKWARRHPALAALIVVVAVATGIIAGILVQTGVALKEAALREAGRAREAEGARDQANRELRNARRNLYMANLLLAQQSWHELQLPRMAALLDEVRPAKDEPDPPGFEWYYLRRLAQQGLRKLERHQHSISGLAFRPDGRRLASVASGENFVRLWDTATGVEVGSPLGPPGQGYSSVAWSADGRRILATGTGGIWCVWDTDQLKPRFTSERRNEGTAWAALSPNGRLVAGTDAKAGAVVWDIEGGKQVATIRSPEQQVLHLAWSPDGKLLAAATGYRDDPPAGADRGGTVLLYDLATEQVADTLRGHTDAVLKIGFTGDGALLVSTSRDGTAKVWDVAARKERLTFRNHGRAVQYLSISPDLRNRWIATVSTDKMVHIWEPSGRESCSFLDAVGASYAPGKAPPTALAFSPDGLELAVSGLLRAPVSIYDARTGREVYAAPLPVPVRDDGGRALVSRVAYDAEGTHLAVGYGDGTLFLWERSTGRPAFTDRGPLRLSKVFALRPDGKEVAAVGFDRVLRLCDPVSGEVARQLPGTAHRLAYSPDGMHLAAADGDRVTVWEAATGREVTSLRGHQFAVEKIVFSPDGRRLVTAGGNGGLAGETRVWDLLTGRETYPLRVSRGQDYDIAFSADGRRLATASHDGQVRLWDAEGRELRRFRGHSGPVRAVAFRKDGRQLVSGGQDRSIRVWDTETGEELYHLAGHMEHVMAVAFSADGSRIASGSRDRTVRIWHCVTHKELLTLHGHLGSVVGVRFSDDGQRLISSGTTHDVRIWDAGNPTR